MVGVSFGFFLGGSLWLWVVVRFFQMAVDGYELLWNFFGWQWAAVGFFWEVVGSFDCETFLGSSGLL